LIKNNYYSSLQMNHLGLAQSSKYFSPIDFDSAAVN